MPHTELMTVKLKEGWQQGAFSARRAAPPIVSFGLTTEQHFAAWQSFATNGAFPLGEPTQMEWDLQFDAEQTVAHLRDLRS